MEPRTKTHREEVFEKLGKPLDWHPSLKELAKETNLPLKALQEVYNRGVGAWKTNPTSVRLKGTFEKNYSPSIPRQARLGKEQWGFARTYSFINKGKTFETADADIAKKYQIA
jgi:hypothetical protein